MDWINQAIKNLALWIGLLFDKIIDFFNSIYDDVVQFFNYIKDFFDVILNYLNDFFGSFFDTVNNWLLSLVEYIPDMSSYYTSFYNNYGMQIYILNQWFPITLCLSLLLAYITIWSIFVSVKLTLKILPFVG